MPNYLLGTLVSWKSRSDSSPQSISVCGLSGIVAAVRISGVLVPVGKRKKHFSDDNKKIYYCYG
jgi:hypothetical protein